MLLDETTLTYPTLVHLLNIPRIHVSILILVETRPHRGLAPNISGIDFISLSISPHGVHAFIITYYKGSTEHHALSDFIKLYDMVLDKPGKTK